MIGQSIVIPNSPKAAWFSGSSSITLFRTGIVSSYFSNLINIDALSK